MIRTLLKDVSPDTMGNAATLFHEHLSFEWARVRGPNARGNLTGPAKEVKPVLEQLEVALSEGVGCIVDAGTDDVGRDVGFLKQIAAQTGCTSWRAAASTCSGRIPRDVATQSPRIRLPTTWCARRAPSATARSARSAKPRMRR